MCYDYICVSEAGHMRTVFYLGMRAVEQGEIWKLESGRKGI